MSTHVSSDFLKGNKQSRKRLAFTSGNKTRRCALFPQSHLPLFILSPFFMTQAIMTDIACIKWSAGVAVTVELRAIYEEESKKVQNIVRFGDATF